MAMAKKTNKAMTTGLDAIYVRYSSDQQTGNTSVDVQISTCKHAIAAAGGDPEKARVFVDRAKTGKTVGGRTALADLRRAAQAGEIGRVWTYKWDRLGRSLSDAACIVRELETTGAEIISATEGADALTRGVLLSVAEWYSTALSERTAAGRRQRFKEHAFTGSIIPYGYRVVENDDADRRGHNGRRGRRGPKYLEVDPDEASVVRDVFKAFLDGKGVKAIARSLTTRGIQPRKKKGGWAWTTLRNMLQSEWYRGRVYYGRWDCGIDDETGKKWQRLKPESEWDFYDDESLRIISDEDFKKVQAMMAKRARPHMRHRTRGQRRVFTGLAFCECGALLYRRTYKSRAGVPTWTYLHCGKRHREGVQSTCTCSRRVREDTLLAAMIETLMPILTGGESLIEDAIKIARDRTATSRQDAERIRAEITTIDKDAAKLVKRMMDDELGAAAKKLINRESTKLEARRQELQGILESLTDSANDNTEQLAAAVQQALDEAKQTLTSVASPRQLNDLLRMLVGEFVVHGDGSVTPREDMQSTGNAGGAPFTTRHLSAFGNISGAVRTAFWSTFPNAA